MKKVLLVGSSGSVGVATKTLLLLKGYSVIQTTSSKERSQLQDFYYMDLCDKSSIESLAGVVGEIDAIIFSAGKEPQQSLQELKWEHLEEMIDIHYKGVLWLIKNLQFKLSANSSIILISSIAAYKGSYDPVYASLKGALNSLVRTLARALAPTTSVMGIAPGLIQGSPVFNRMTDDFRQNHIKANLTGVLLTTDDVASTIYFLLNQKQLTGQIIHLNGGHYFGN